MGAAVFYEKSVVGSGVARHAVGKMLELADEFFALGFAIFAAAGIADANHDLIEVVEEFCRAAFWHAIFYPVVADACDGFEEGAAAVRELDPVDGEVDIWTVTGGIIPDFQ